MTKGERIKARREELGITQVALADMIGESKQTVYKYESGLVSNIPSDKVELIAKALRVQPEWIMGWDVSSSPIPPGFIPLPKTYKVPLVGRIACGTPITAEENLEGYVDVPVDRQVDFALLCEGDSMVDAGIDATPIGINVRSTVATYANVHDELRKIFARTPDAKKSKYKAGDFSYNTGKLRCPTCDGTGSISLDVQFLPDVNIPCPDCRGSRYGKDASKIRCVTKSGEAYTLPEIMDMDVRTALSACKDWKLVSQRLNVLNSLGLGYLTLGEETPGLSGGEAQRLKLASEMGKAQSGSVFVFDEPTIGLHPLDVQTLLTVFQTLIESGATVIVIEHDLDVIRSADYILDMGPGGGEAGGRLVACGTPEQIKNAADSVTGKFI